MPELPPQAHSSNNEDQQPGLRSDNVDGPERLSTGLRGLFHPPRYLSATGLYCAPYTRCLPIDCRPCPREPSGPFLYHTGTPITLIVPSVHITYIPAPLPCCMTSASRLLLSHLHPSSSPPLRPFSLNFCIVLSPVASGHVRPTRPCMFLTGFPWCPVQSRHSE
ncbi:hypothetical protein HBI56_085910 [Parastagonospora nodorum]|nr:hypothetical protein HBH56_113640 [Parastagonospora nodorum]KAH3921535.1 hypothetical protein HBH54_238780 [Parastagonospora nodorum]KAH3951137.1 hypothetical protein HBH53_069320 [Parastagonospora nodorum]KAH3962981.1 hypothetical protein HBH51_169990 [Parastagonospora nodorum]KAH3979067.1 hypothetical protein HBH52_096880 [Parastagonospora nodorum]